MFRVLYYTFRREMPWNHRGAKMALIGSIIGLIGWGLVLYGGQALIECYRALFTGTNATDQVMLRGLIGMSGVLIVFVGNFSPGMFAPLFNSVCKTLAINRKKFVELTKEQRSDYVVDSLTYRLELWSQQMKQHADHPLFPGIEAAAEEFRSAHRVYKRFGLIGGEPEDFLEAKRIAAAYS